MSKKKKQTEKIQKNTRPKMTLAEKKKRLPLLIDARKMQLGTLSSSIRNLQEAIKNVLTIDDSILNLLLEDSELRR